MTSRPMTPGGLAARWSVADRTVRRMAEAYELVYGALPRSNRGHRQFPLLAVERLEEGMRTLRANPGASMERVLTAQRDGQHLQHQFEQTTGADILTPLLAELTSLRAELADLRALVIERTALPSAALTPGEELLLTMQKDSGWWVTSEGEITGFRSDGTPEEEVHPRYVVVKVLLSYNLVTEGSDWVYRPTDEELLRGRDS